MSRNNRNLYRSIFLFVCVISILLFPKETLAAGGSCSYTVNGGATITLTNGPTTIIGSITGPNINQGTRVFVSGLGDQLPTNADGILICPDEFIYQRITYGSNQTVVYAVYSESGTSPAALVPDCVTNACTGSEEQIARNVCTTEQTATFSRIVTEMSNNITSFSNSVNSSTVNTTELKNYSDRIIASYNEYQQARSNALECAKASWDDTVDELWNKLEEATSTLMNKELTGQDKTAAQEIVSNLRGAVGNLGEEVEVDCSTYQGVLDIVSEIFGWIQIAAPILLILFGSIDFGKAVISNDQDALKKATSNFVKRAIAAVAIFFLPLIINLIFQLPGVADLFEDAFCEIKV